MSIVLRRASERFHTEAGWLDSWHTFSFAEHYDPAHVKFRSLRVINDDRIQAADGFPMHAHRDMEIISYVLAGALEHQDSLGHGSLIRPGEVQRMTAGTGVEHSEYNPSATDPVHFLQIWILPERNGLRPSYEQRAFPSEEMRNQLRLVASREAREGSVLLHQDVSLYVTQLDPGRSLTYERAKGRHAWAHVARGSVALNEIPLREGDGVGLSEEMRLVLRTRDASAEVLVFDLA
jgi:hypothetical protein